MLPDRQTERLAARRELPPRPTVVIAAPRPRDAGERPLHDARLLTEGGNEAEIRLDGVRYVLRITRQGKLILTK
jgi:hemin uptake protein HemP